MKVSSKLGALAVSAAMVFMLGAFTGCGDNSEQIIRDTLTQELNGYKNLDADTIAEFDKQMGSTNLESLGISNEDLAKALLQGFDYQIDSVNVDGQTAEAVVTLTHKDFSSLDDKVTDIVTEITSDPVSVANMSSEEITQLYGQKVMEAMDNMEVVTSDPITITYELNGNVWEPTPESEAKFNAIFLG